MTSHYPLAIIGAGPAGMAAAITAARHNIKTVVIDQQNSPGGQIYRALEHSPIDDKNILGGDYHCGADLIAQFRAADVDYLPNATVWNIDKTPDNDRELGVLVEGHNRFIRADKLLLATGAQERPMPIPGWQLPGVMTAGAGQILLKSAATIPADGVVLAGYGPLLLLLTCQYLRAGVKIGAILDTTPRASLRKVLPYLPGALRASEYLTKGARMIASIRQSGVSIYKRVSMLKAEGTNSLERVRFEAKGQFHALNTTTLLLHHGIIPGVHFPQLVGCELEWNEQQHCWQAHVDEWGECSAENVFISGDGSGIVGANGAELQGSISALQIACQLGVINKQSRDELAVPIRKSLRKHSSIRPFLDAIYEPSQTVNQLTDETIVCRCEEVTAGEVRKVAQLGCPGPNQAKAFTRCGMGPCQGRQCGETVAALMADVHGQSIAEIGYYRARPPLAPVTLGQLAASD